MSVRRLAPDSEQPASFAFTDENRKKVAAIIARYPDGRQASAVLPLLDLAQRQHQNWLPRKAIEHVAELLGMPHMRVLEVATFYSMFNLAPVGKYLIQLCGTTPCWLRGSDEVKAAIREELGIGMGEATPDGLFSTIEVECLGACVNAPMVQINDDFYEDLDKARMTALLQALRRGEAPKPGPQAGRTSSEPAGGPTTLIATGAE
jgi:NADH-quinone oxidoreductase E subunit